jgi:peptide chain release factor 1
VFDRLNGLEDELADVEASLADPAVTGDQKALRAASQRHKELAPLVQLLRDYRSRQGDLEVARSLFAESAGEDRESMRAEVTEAEADLLRMEEELKLALLPKDPNDGRNVIVEIRGAEGGEEANLFARDLFDMYQGYATRMGWFFEVLSSQTSAMGGFDEVVFALKGDTVWSHMKFEGGPHRVQRVPATESQGRIHTSSATVTVFPEAEEVDVHIDQNDLQIDVYRSGGAGGQSVNTTDSAVRITHKPTGVVVTMQDERSQLQNRAKAMQVLRSRLLQLEQDRVAAEQSGVRKAQVGGGGRSEKIRTYNYKENRVTDHRIGLTIYRLQDVLAGDLSDVSDALIAEERARQLESGAV